MNEKLIILGGGGHASVLAATIQEIGYQIYGYTDVSRESINVKLKDIRYLGNDDELFSQDLKDKLMVNGLGSINNTHLRAKLFKRFKNKGCIFQSVIHPSANVITDKPQGEGLQVMAGAIVSLGVETGHNVLINSGAIIEHGCKIEDHTHIATGAIIAGDCRIGRNVHVGCGATVIQGVNIADNSVIAAGAVVINDVPPNCLVAGVPAEVKR